MNAASAMSGVFTVERGDFFLTTLFHQDFNFLLGGFQGLLTGAG
jgi:hypothetical protein